MKAIFRRLSVRICISLFIVFAVACVFAQPAAGQTNSTTDQIAALQLQLTNAWLQVEAIVNQPVPAYRYDPDDRVAIYSPGWFHPGAMTPDFNNVDVRKSQELTYTSQWVSSDVSPTMMFHGSDIEFNAMTKLFYTNRDLPKKRLTEAEMLQINSLYRIIGRSQAAIEQLQSPPDGGTTTATSDAESDTNSPAPPPAIAAIERIPQQTRILYGSIAIGTLVVLVIVLQFVKKKSD